MHNKPLLYRSLTLYPTDSSSPPACCIVQIPGLLVDLRAYLQTLQAVHSGADLGSAASSVLGFSQRDLKGGIKQSVARALQG